MVHAAIDRTLKGGHTELDARLSEALREWLAAEGRAALARMPREDRATSTLQSNLGALLLTQGKLDEAEPLWREALEASRVKLGDRHTDTIASISNLGTLLQAQGKLNEAEPLVREALEARRATLGDRHPDMLFNHGACADLYHDSSNVKLRWSTIANPLAQKMRITEQKILYELLHELDAQCDAMPPDPAIDVSGLTTVLSQVHPDDKMGPGGMALIHMFTRSLLEAILQKAVDLAPAMLDLQPEPTEIKPEIKPEGEPAAVVSEPAESVIRLLDEATEQCLQGEFAKYAKNEAHKALRSVQGGGPDGLVMSKEAVAAALAEWLDRRQVAEDDAPPPPALRSESAVIYFTAVLEYLTVEVMELAGSVYRDSRGLPLADLIVHRQTDLVAKTSFLTAETRTLRERIDAGGGAEKAVRDAVRAIHTSYGADYDFHDCWDFDGKLIDTCELPKDYLSIRDPDYHRGDDYGWTDSYPTYLKRPIYGAEDNTDEDEDIVRSAHVLTAIHMDGELAALWAWAGSSALSPTQAALWMALDATPLTRRRHEGDLSELRRLQALESARAASAANLRVEEFWAGLGVSHDHLHSRTPHEVVRHREGVTPLMVTPDHGDVAVLDWLKAIHNLGALLERQGKLDEAEPLLRKALEASRATLGDRHPHTLRSINNLGRLLKDQGKLDEAEPLLREALQATRATLGNRHPGTLAAIHDLGALLKDQGKLDEAEPLLREALEARRATQGDRHPDTIAAMLDPTQGKLDEAEPLLREALEVRRATLGDRHPDTLAAIHDLGALLKAQGKLDEAEPLLRQALEAHCATLGDRHPDTLPCMHNLGKLLYNQGKLDEAEPLLRKALDARRATLGDRHPQTLDSINNLGALLHAQGKLGEAEPLVREVLEASRATLGDRHPGTLIYVNNLGALLKDQGKLDEAKPLMLEALEAMRATLGDQHPHTLAAIHNLESLLKAQGKLDEAEPLLREALEVRRATLGDRHPQTLAAIHNLGSLLATHGKHDEALPLLVEHSRATLGDRHPFTLNFMSMHQARELKRAPLVGEQVLVLGLVAKPELNHRTGTAAGWDSERGRYSVRLQDGSTVTLKPANLRKL